MVPLATDYQTPANIATAVGVFLIAGGLVISALQTRANTKINRMQAMTVALDLVTNRDSAFTFRAWILRHVVPLNEYFRQLPEGASTEFEGENGESLTWVDVRDRAETVCRAWDRLGWLVQDGSLDREIFGMWSWTIVRLYEALWPYIVWKRTEGKADSDWRPRSNDDFAGFFVAMAIRAQKHIDERDVHEVTDASMTWAPK